MKNCLEAFNQQMKITNDEALILSNPIQITFPMPTQIKSSIFSTLASYVTFFKGNHSESQLYKQFLPIPNQFFLLLHGNSIRIFKHCHTEEEELQCQIISQTTLPFNLKCVKVSPFFKCQKNKGFYFIAEQSTSWYLQTLYYDPTQNKIEQVSYIRLQSRINCWSYIHHRQLLVWCENMKIYHYEVKDQGLILIQSLDTQININEELTEGQGKHHARSKSKAKNSSQSKSKQKKNSFFSLQYCTILGQRGREQQSTIVIFFVLYNQQINGMKIKCKQIKYPLQDSQMQNKGYRFLQYKKNSFPKLILNPKTHQIISHNTANPEILRTISISQIGNSYLVRFKFEIIVIKKKFDKEYFAIDNIYKKNKQCSVSMAYNSNIVSCITSNIMEISKVEINDNKASTSIIDFIDINKQYQAISELFQKKIKKQNQSDLKMLDFNQTRERSILYSLWISTDLTHEQHRNNVYLVFQVPFMQGDIEKKAYFLYMTKRTSRIKKIISLAQRVDKPEQIIGIQKLGESLGINQSDFYFNMWKASKRGVDDIFCLLIRCRNYRKIIEQLKGVLRKKTFAATRIQKILQLIQQSNLETLKSNLTEENLVNYFHAIFVTRKMMIYESNFEIDEKQFSEMTEINLFDLVGKIISFKIYPKIKSTSVWAAEVQKSAKLNLIQVLNLFKMPLLQQYDLFLSKILQKYPISILKVIEYFPELLPNYPFEEIIQPQDQGRELFESSNHLQRAVTFKQRQFFSAINQDSFKSQSNFLNNILTHLYPFYPTSLIKKYFGLARQRSQIKGQKYCYHTIIQLDKENYKKKLQSISSQNNGLYFFMVTLDCLIKGRYENKTEPELIDLEQAEKDNNQKIQVEEQNVNVEENQLKYEISKEESDQYYEIRKMCWIFKNNHNLPIEIEHQLIISSCLFQLLIQHYIIEIYQYSLWHIASQPIQKWIALFFLGNKQQKDLIFTQLMAIFDDKPQSFIQAMQRFINSEHCSKIELSILIDLMTNMGKQFQCKNQKIIEIILNGFCARVQISDIVDATHFNQRLKLIQLGPSLLMKADKIVKLGICRKIFSTFYLEETLLKDLLQNTTEVINNMLENFFMGKIKEQGIKLAISQTKAKKIQIKNIRDVFDLLHYLQENVLFDLTAEQLVKTYCKKLIEWQTFDEIHYLLYQSDYLQQYELDLQKIVVQIQTEILGDLHNKQNFSYTESKNKAFVNSILEIYRGQIGGNLVVIRERAKIAISDIFLEWKYIIKSKQIQQMCEMWEIEHAQQSGDVESSENKKDLMNRIIQTYAEHLNVKYLEDLCRYFTIATSQKGLAEERNEKFYRYCTSLCDALLVKQKYKEACEIICIVNQVFEMNYSLMSQCLLRSLVEKYIYKQALNNIVDVNQSQIHHSDSEINIKNSDSVIEEQALISDEPNYNAPKQKFFLSNNNVLESSEQQQDIDPLYLAKAYIDHFIESWKNEDEECMKKMFGQYFPQEAEIYQPGQTIVIHPQLLFNLGNQKMQLSHLWEIILNITNSMKLKKQDIIYTYFFLQMGLVQPSLGFQEIQYIGYNHGSIVKILVKFMQICQKESSRYKIMFLDYSIFFKKYLDALTKILILKYHQLNENQLLGQESGSEATKKQSEGNMLNSVNLTVVRDQFLKKGEYKDDPLTQIIENLKSVTLEAERNCKKRLAIFNIKSSVKNFNLSSRLKMTAKRGHKILEKQVEADQAQDQEEDMRGPEANMMSFDFFTKVKNKVKNNTSFSEVDLSERVFAESMFGLGDANKKSKKYKSNEMQLLRELIQNSRRQIEEKQREQQQQKLKLTQRLITEIQNKSLVYHEDYESN